MVRGASLRTLSSIWAGFGHAPAAGHSLTAIYQCGLGSGSAPQTSQTRDLHIGIDLCAPAGAPV